MQKISILLRIRFFINNIRLRNKIFLAYAFLLLLCMTMMGYFLYSETVKTANEQVLISLSGNLRQSSQYLSNLLANTEKDVNLYSTNKFVQDILTGYEDKPIIIQFDESRNLISMMNAFEKSKDIYEIRNFFKAPKRFLNDMEKLFPNYSTFGEQELEWITSSKLGIWTNVRSSNPGTQSFSGISYIKRMVSINNYGEELGIIAFDIKEPTIRKAIDSLKEFKESKAYVIDGKGDIISSSDKTYGKLKKLEMDLPGEISNEAIYSSTLTIDEKRYLRIVKKAGIYPYYIVDDVPMEEINLRNVVIFKRLAFITFIILVLSFTLAYLISQGITRRIHKLAMVMDNIDADNFDIRLPDNYNDEISSLSRNFNKMLLRIKKLVEENYRSNLEKKQADVRLLQAQINPHFLYNTLNTVTWLAVRANAEEICYIVGNLSNFLRLGLNKGEEITTISNELWHVQSYFNIQKYRFQDRIHLNIEVPEDLYTVSIQSLTLQPLVENCILHGILKEEGRNGNITVEGYSFEGKIVLEVSDNGIGMDLKTLDRVKKGLCGEQIKDTGYGLRNVHQRLRIKYGDEYGLNIISQAGAGTNFIIIIPYTCK